MTKSLKQNLHKTSEEKPEYWLYILSNSKANGPLYLGDCYCLKERMDEHLKGLRRDYAHYHRLDRLVYFEVWDDQEKFTARLRRVRNWPRDMRLLLIDSLNPGWDDLLQQFLNEHADQNNESSNTQKQEKVA